MKNASKSGKSATRKQFVTGWFPVNSPSTHALIWRGLAGGEPVFIADVSRRGEKLKELKAATAEELAGMLTQELGPAPKSLIRLTGAGAESATI